MIDQSRKKVLYDSFTYLFLSFNRGCTRTDTPEKLRDTLISTIKLINQNLKNSQIPTIDVDAFSIQISHHGRLSSFQKMSISRLLKFFGKDNSDISLPKFTGWRKPEGIFSTPGSRSTYVDDNYQEKESIITKTPVQLAILEECKEKLVEGLQSFGWYMKVASRKGICFDPGYATHTPNYGELVETILESCYTQSNCFFLHIANLGTRLKIITSSEQQGRVTLQTGADSLVELFELIKAVRDSGVEVSLLQLDIAFTIPAQNLYHLEYNKTQTAEKVCEGEENFDTLLEGETIFLSQVTYPMHTVIPDLSNSKQLGTLLFRTKKPESLSTTNTERTTNTRGDNETSTIRFPTHPLEREDLEHWSSNGYLHVAKQLLSGTSGEKAFELIQQDIHSVKIYHATLTHTMLQDRYHVADFLNRNKMGFLQNKTFGQLKRGVAHAWNAHNDGVKAVQAVGAQIRLETSLRPTKGSTLRKNGHLVDLFLHVHLSIWSVFKQYKIKIHYLQPELVQAKVIILINQLYEILCCRDSLPFKGQYKDARYHQYIKFKISIIMITAGYAPGYGGRFIRPWFRDPQRFDPHGLHEQFANKTFLSNISSQSQISQTNPNPQLKPPTNLMEALSECISEPGATCVLEYCTECMERPNLSLSTEALNCFKCLSLPDKIRLVSNLETIVIPLLSKSSEDSEAEESLPGDADVNEDEDYEGSDEEEDFLHTDTDYANYIMPPLSRVTNPVLAFSQNVIGQEDRLVEDEAVATIQLLSLLIKAVNVSNIIPFHMKMFKFIVQCHEKKIQLPRQTSPLEELAPRAKTLLDTKGTSPNAKAWRSLFQQLRVAKQHSNTQRVDDYIRALCKHYYFPCPGIEVDSNDFESSDTSSMNNILNDILSEDNVTEIVHLRTQYSRSLYRQRESTNIEVINPDLLMTRTDSPPMLVPENLEGDGWLVIRRAFNLGTETALARDAFRGDLKAELAKQSSLFNIFLDKRGNTHSQFNFSTVDEWEQHHNYPFSGRAFDQTDMKAELALPSVALRYKQDILYYDTAAEKTFLYVHSKGRVIIYDYVGLNHSPLIEVIAFMKSSVKHHWARYTVPGARNADIYRVGI